MIPLSFKRKEPDQPAAIGPYGSIFTPDVLRWRWPVLIAFTVFCFAYGFFFALTAPYLIVPLAAPLGVLGLLIIWALPDLKRAPTRTLTRLLLALLIGLIAWPSYIAIALPGLPWITMLRLIGLPMTIALLVCLSVSKEFRDELNQSLKATPMIWQLVVGFAIIQLLTIPLSTNPAQSTQKFLTAQLNWTAVFFASCYAFRKIGRANRGILVIFMLVLFICLLGLIEANQRRILWAGYLPDFLKASPDYDYMRPVFRRYTNIYRVKATFTTPLGLAEFLALCSSFLLHLTLGNYKLWIKAVSAGLLALSAYMIEQTDSRLGMAGLLVSFMVYLMIWSVIRWKRHRAHSLVASAIVFSYPALFCTAVAATFFVGRIRNRIWGGGAQRASSDAREDQIRQGIPKIISNPFGHGAGQSADTLGHYSPGGFLTIDNYYLAIALEYGVVGFLLYYGFVLLTIYYAMKYAYEGRNVPDRELELLQPLAAALTAFFVIKAVFSQQDNHPFVFLMMGMTIALVSRVREALAKQAPTASQSQRRIRRLGNARIA